MRFQKKNGPFSSFTTPTTALRFAGSHGASGLEPPLGLLQDYALLDEVAADLDVSPRTLRRRINGPDGWPHLRWGGKIRLHVPTVRKLIEAETRSRNPRRGR